MNIIVITRKRGENELECDDNNNDIVRVTESNAPIPYKVTIGNCVLPVWLMSWMNWERYDYSCSVHG